MLPRGGGERSRGETGHRGLSLKSGGAKGFRGVGDWIFISSAAGCKGGMAVDDRLLGVEACPDTPGRTGRCGLRSCWLFLCDLGPLRRVADVVLRGFCVGDGSREGSGECVDELFADDCFDDLALSVVAMVDGLVAFWVTFLDASDATFCRLAVVLEN